MKVTVTEACTNQTCLFMSFSRFSAINVGTSILAPVCHQGRVNVTIKISKTACVCYADRNSVPSR